MGDNKFQKDFCYAMAAILALTVIFYFVIRFEVGFCCGWNYYKVEIHYESLNDHHGVVVRCAVKEFGITILHLVLLVSLSWIEWRDSFLNFRISSNFFPKNWHDSYLPPSTYGKGGWVLVFTCFPSTTPRPNMTLAWLDPPPHLEAITAYDSNFDLRPSN
jgi:hypothetical protein